MKKLKIYTPKKMRRYRNLPHWQRQDGIYFITFRLNHSLPKKVIEALKEERNFHISNLRHQGLSESAIKIALRKFHTLHFGKFDQLLDNSKTGPHYLREDRIAKIVADAIMFFDEQRFIVINYCIMSNHVHLIICQLQDELENILGTIKKFSARKINQLLKRTGTQLWQFDSYDHIVRGESELDFYIKYNLLNPVKAGIIKNWQEWRWSYTRKEFQKYTP